MTSRTTWCLMCFQPHMCLRYDKKSRPYLKCLACGTVIFMPLGGISLSGYNAAVARVVRDISELQREHSASISAIEAGSEIRPEAAPLASPAAVAAHVEVAHAGG